MTGLCLEPLLVHVLDISYHKYDDFLVIYTYYHLLHLPEDLSMAAVFTILSLVPLTLLLTIKWFQDFRKRYTNIENVPHSELTKIKNLQHVLKL